jgi:hypothetical protein
MQSVDIVKDVIEMIAVRLGTERLPKRLVAMKFERAMPGHMSDLSANAKGAIASRLVL